MDDLVLCLGIETCKDQASIMKVSCENAYTSLFSYLGSEQSFNHLPWVTVYKKLIHFIPSVPLKGKVGPTKCFCRNCSLSGMVWRKMVEFSFLFPCNSVLF